MMSPRFRKELGVLCLLRSSDRSGVDPFADACRKPVNRPAISKYFLAKMALGIWDNEKEAEPEDEKTCNRTTAYFTRMAL